jgi:hypothetical protein
MTREELKQVIASKPNQLAAKAIAAIRARSPMEELEKLVVAGASDKHYYMDPAHPRSRYRVEHVIDACFESSFGVVSETRTNSPSGSRVEGFVLGHVPAASGTSAYFEYLVDRGFSPGSNGYRGELFSAILKGCFYRDTAESAVAMDLASILVRKGRVDIQKFAENSYEWTGSPEKLRRVMELGAKPKPEMLDCALRYCVCAQNQGDPPTGRADVLRTLLSTGLAPTKPLGRLGTAKEQVAFLEAAGLADKVVPRSSPLPASHTPSPTASSTNPHRSPVR